ncbi:MAG: BRO-N domain-containing protein [Geminicoccaceae bacterium]
MTFPLQEFEYESEQTIRMIDQNGEPWFVLADVCRVLEIRNPRDAAGRLEMTTRKRLSALPTVRRAAERNRSTS